MSFDAVVLAGGGGRRMGADKPALTVGSASLLDRALAAVAGAASIVVVGPRRPVSAPVLWALESPAGGGPVAALAAGLGPVTAPLVAVLAADQPFLTSALVGALAAAVGSGTGALLVDADGRDQLLAGVWRTDAVRAALPAEPAGAAVRSVVGPLVTARLPAGPDWLDCDTADDLRRARSMAGE